MFKHEKQLFHPVEIESPNLWIGCKNLPVGIAMVGAALIFAGFAVLMFFGSVAAGRGTALLAKKFCARIRRRCNDE